MQGARRVVKPDKWAEVVEAARAKAMEPLLQREKEMEKKKREKKKMKKKEKKEKKMKKGKDVASVRRALMASAAAAGSKKGMGRVSHEHTYVSYHLIYLLFYLISFSCI